MEGVVLARCQVRHLVGCSHLAVGRGCAEAAGEDGGDVLGVARQGTGGRGRVEEKGWVVAARNRIHGRVGRERG
jgi:hypothetical protein